MLSDTQIKHAIRWRGLNITGFTTTQLQPASYDVRLHPSLLILHRACDPDAGPLDPKQDTTGEWLRWEMDDEDGYVLRHGDLVLGSTIETITVGVQLQAQLEGKSSLGRLGLVVHSTAGYLDPGFEGQVTLELSCVHRRGVILYPGMAVGQIALQDCAAVENPYSGKYLHQEGPTASRYHLNWIPEQKRWR